MRESNILKSSSTLKSSASKPARLPKAAPESAKRPSKPPAAPVEAAKRPSKPPPAPVEAAKRPSKPPPPADEPAKRPVFDASAFASHDEAARAALQKTREAWLVDADAELARTRFAEVAKRLKRPALLVGASLTTLQREKSRLASVGVKVLLIPGADGRVARGDGEALKNGGPLLVLVTVDALATDEVLRVLEKASIGAVAIDSAELASERGHELRPAFARLSALLPRLGKPSRFGLARPVTAAARRDAQALLGLSEATLVDAPLVGAKVLLDARAVRGERRNATLLEVLRELPRPGVILCATPHEVDGVCAVIGAERNVACRVHSGMPASERAAMLERFERGEAADLLVTTSALGPDMGIPGLGEVPGAEPRVGFGSARLRRPLAFVLHHHAPSSLEQYTRELAVLAESADATAVLFYDSAHRSMNQAILEQQRLPAQKVLPFTRAFEATLASGKPLKLEALALQTGVSRRTSERLVALLADAGLVRREKAGLSLVQTGAQLESGADALAASLEKLQQSDAARLAAVERFAEGNECKRRILAQYFGARPADPCGLCASCRARGGAQQRANSR